MKDPRISLCDISDLLVLFVFCYSFFKFYTDSSFGIGVATFRFLDRDSFETGHIVGHNAFTGGYGLDMKRLQVGGGGDLDVKEFHRFGMLWDETGYTFYIDGKEDSKITGHLSACPEFILISTEVRGSRRGDCPLHQSPMTRSEILSCGLCKSV